MTAPLLLVTASLESHQALARTVDGLGVTLHTAATGEQALETLLERDFALIIVPVELPDMSGLELASLIHGDRSKRHMPLAMIAPHGIWEAKMYRGHEAGIVEHVAEPIQRGVLRGKLRLYMQLYEHHRRFTEQAALLERSNRHFQDFAHAAAHDLRAPLRSIAGFASKLSGRIGGQEGTRELSAILRASERMEALIRDMLSYARSGEGAQDHSVCLNSCLREVVADLHGELSASGGRIEAAPLPRVTGNSVQLRQVLQNVLSNAIKYRRSDVALVIRVHSEVSSGFLILTIEDNGTGFDQALEDEMFLPFKRLVSFEDGGSGIGLATTRRIVEQHGGTVRATGKVGVGAKFDIRLPMSSPEIGTFRRQQDANDRDAPTTVVQITQYSAPPVLAPPEAVVEEPCILLVDDNEFDLELVREVLDLPLPVLEADRAERALELLHGKVVAVISDYNMPGHDGVWLLSEVQKKVPEARRILLSGAPDKRCQAAVESGVIESVVEKCADVQRLGTLIASAVASGRLGSGFKAHGPH